jgi:hypothetical protein
MLELAASGNEAQRAITISAFGSALINDQFTPRVL